MNDGDTEELVPTGADGASASGFEELKEIASEQDQEAQEFALAFLKKILRIRGVRITRADFLNQELRKLGLGDKAIEAAVRLTPVQAGIGIGQLDELAKQTITFETRKSAGMSFAAGIPGGLAMAATIPADITQYYVHAFRVMQKLAYIYGWQDFLGELEEVDDETLGKFVAFLGVMLGVGGASASLGRFAQQVTQPALQKQITQKALTKTAWYGPLKQTLKLIGVRLTKDSFAKTVTKVVPIAGGAISGGMTLVSLGGQSERLRKHLRELPPPGVDASNYLAAVRAFDADKPGEGRVLSQVGEAIGGVFEGASDVAGNAAEGAKEFVGGAASRVGGFLGIGRRKQTDSNSGGSASA